jgi:polyisoprenoid-binding protein YceI
MNKKYLFLTLAFIPFVLAACNNSKVTTTPKSAEDTSGQVATILNETGTYIVSASKSSLKWFGERIGGSSHDGTLDIKDGQIILSGGSLSSAEFVIDMTTIKESKQSPVIKHLSGPDFFDTETYPESTLKIVSATQIGDSSTYNIEADLTIKDSTNPITFPAEVNVRDTTLTADASFTIDRTRWNVIYGSGNFFKELGDKAIKNEISYTINIIAELN